MHFDSRFSAASSGSVPRRALNRRLTYSSAKYAGERRSAWVGGGRWSLHEPGLVPKIVFVACYSLAFRKRNELVITETELKLMAVAAKYKVDILGPLPE